MTPEDRFERYVKQVWDRGGMSAPFDPGADPDGWIFKPDAFSASYHASTTLLAKDIGAILDKHYPGWSWVVQPDESNQFFNIFNWHLHDTFGYTIRMKDIMFDPDRKEAHRAAGEILRRFRLPAKGFTGEVPEIYKALPRDVMGKCIPDISDWESSKIREKQEIALAYAEGRARIVEQNGQRILKVRNA